MKTKSKLVTAAIACALPALSVFSQTDSAPSPAPATPTPEMQAVLDHLAKLEPKPLDTLTAVEARKQPTPADAVMALLKAQDKSTAPEAVADVDNRTIPGPDGKIKIRVYTPKGAGPFPVIVYYHGGGFVIADLDTYDSSPRALANAVEAIVVSSHYRQGPEHKFPAAQEDAFAAYRWTLDHAAEFKGDPTRVAVAGESAGGNLAAAVSMMANEQGVKVPIHQLLVYPVAGADMNTPSYKEYAQAKPLNKPMMAWFFKNAATPADAENPRLNLLNSPALAQQPPTTIITAQIDPLRSEGEALAMKLKAAGVPVSYKNYDGATHEFFGMGAVVPQAKAAVAFAAQELKTAFAGTKSAASF